ncbi:MAG TPA: hypothetical protein VEH06_01970 [Candidatus Bathyarchaeia archaeon]|nr:hypothetical protein [Candidatus Bathyarchaeia archaeon]
MNKRLCYAAIVTIANHWRPDTTLEIVSLLLGIALHIIGIEIIVVRATGRTMQFTPAGGKKVNFKICRIH